MWTRVDMFLGMFQQVLFNKEADDWMTRICSNGQFSTAEYSRWYECRNEDSAKYIY